MNKSMRWYSGLDWKWGDQDGGAGSIGTVYRAMDNATVYVCLFIYKYQLFFYLKYKND